jgi:hypothetical protein
LVRAQSRTKSDLSLYSPEFLKWGDASVASTWMCGARRARGPNKEKRIMVPKPTK